MIFSMLLRKTLPFVSQVMHDGGEEGTAKTIGPMISEGESAETQVSSSSFALTESGAARVLISSLSTLRIFRFLDLLSPLKTKDLTILYSFVKPPTSAANTLISD